MTSLFDYQIKAVHEFEQSTEKNVCLSMPTGSGKTYTFCEIARRYFAEHLKRVLFVVHRIELLDQIKKSLGERCFDIVAGVKAIPSNYDYYVAMVETVNRRIPMLPEFGLVIIDECHFGNFRKLPFFGNEKTRVLGVTATPISKPSLSTMFQKLIIPVTIKQLLDRKQLVNCEPFGFASDLVEMQKFRIKGGEFDEKEMEDFYSSEQMVKNVIESYWSLTPGKKCIVFNVNVKHNQAVYEAFKAEGLNVYALDGETPKEERKEILKALKEQQDAIVCNVGVLTTGFDEPTLQAVFLNRATKSLALYLQMIGRGARTYEGKESFIVVDLGKNTARHGYYDHDHDWESYFYAKEKERKSLGTYPTKECDACGYINKIRALLCDHCGKDFYEEHRAKIEEEKVQRLVKLERETPFNVPTERLLLLAKERNWNAKRVLELIGEHCRKWHDHNPQFDLNYVLQKAEGELYLWAKFFGKSRSKEHKELFYGKITYTDHK
jgi:superfamily II DNA or RNA helicase